MVAFNAEALAGQRALVTGGSRGIGGAIVDELAGMGAEIVIADVDLPAAQAKVDELRARGVRGEAVHADLADRDATLELARSVGVVDLLVNNAAPGQTNAPFIELPDSEWERQFAVIMWAPLILTRELGRAMGERGRGVIVNILSAAVRGPSPFVAPYAAAKAALEIITKCTALELGIKGVRANGVAPTFVPTERNRAVWERVGFTEGSGRANPSGRIATPEDIAGTVGWLCSDAARFVNGQTIHVDGGASAGIYFPPPPSP